MTGKWRRYAISCQSRILFTMLLTLAMAVTFMPAAAYAGGDDAEYGVTFSGKSVWKNGNDVDVFDNEDVVVYMQYVLPDNWSDNYDMSVVFGTGVETCREDYWNWTYDESGYFTGDGDSPDYKVDSSAGTIVFYGSRLASKVDFGDNDEVRARLEIKVTEKSGDNSEIMSEDLWIHIIKSTENYSKEQNCDKLPGRGGGISKYYDVWVRNGNCPEGENLEYTVTDVEVIKGNELLSYIEKEIEDENYWWKYEIKDYNELDGATGEIQFKVTYKDLNDTEQNYTFSVNVCNNVYDVWVNSESGSDRTLAGGTINLKAEGIRDYYDDEGDYLQDDENIAFVWEIIEGNDVAKITPDETDSSRAVLSFADSSDDNYWASAVVRVGVYDASDSSKTVRAYNDKWFSASNNYCEIYPQSINNDLDAGESETIDFELRNYQSGQDGYTVINNATFTLEGNVDDCLDYTQEGSKFTFTRKNNWDVDFEIVASWTDDEGNSNKERVWFCYFSKDYDVWFDDYDWDLYTDGLADYTLNVDNLGSDWSSKYDISFTVGQNEWNNETEERVWKTKFTEGTEYSVKDNVVTLNGAKLTDYADQNVDIVAEVKLKSSGYVLAEESTSCYVREPSIEYYGIRDQKIMKSWGFDINRTNSAWVNNAAHPDGDDVDYEVTGVKIISQNPDEDDKDVVSIEPIYEDNILKYWDVTGLENGSAEIEVTHTDYEGKSTTSNIHVDVVSDMYEMWVDSEDGKNRGLPGEQINLTAQGRHYYYDEDGVYCVSTEEISYKWDFRDEYGKSFASIDVDSNDNSKAIITLKRPEEEVDDWWTTIKVEAFVNGSSESVCESDYGIEMCTNYWQIEPRTAGDLTIGDKTSVEPVLKYYEEDKDPVVVTDNVQYRVFFEGDLTITDADGNKLNHGDVLTGSKINIERTGPDHSALGVRAETVDYSDDDEDGYIYDFVNYSFEYIPDSWEYTLYAVDNDGNEYDDGDTLTLEPGKKVFVYFVTNGEENIEHGMAPIVGFYDCIVDEEGNSLGGDLTNAGFTVKSGSASELGYSSLEDDPFGIEIDTTGMELGTKGSLRYRLYNYDGDDFWTDYENGTFSWANEDEIAVEQCLNVEVAEADGHRLTKVDKVEATCTSEGTEAYWVCDICGKMFSDAEGKTEIEKPAVIAKTEHSWDEGVVTKEATETEPGVRTYTCSVCGETKTEAIPATGSSGSGGSGDSTKTPVTVSDKDSEVQVTAVVDGDTAEISNLTSDDLSKATDGEAISIDVSSDNTAGQTSSDVTSVTITKETAENIAASKADGIEIKLDTATATIDDTTLSSIASQAAGETITLTVETSADAKSTMADAQLKALEALTNPLVIDAYFTSGGKRISDFGGGTVTMKVEYKTTKSIRAWYIKDDGSKESVSCTKTESYAILVVKHFSHYVVEEYEETIDEDEVKAGDTVTVKGSKYKVLSVKSSSGTVALTKAKNVKNFTVPATVKIDGKSFKVVQVNAKAFKGAKIRTVVIGKNVKTLKSKAFASSKAAKVILKTKLLKKAGVKGCLKSSKVNNVKVSISSKLNKKYVKSYKKIFTKANAGRTVTVK